MPVRHRILPLLGWLLLIFAPLLQAAPDNSLLWRIEAPDRPGVTAGYLLGTIHSDDPRVTRLPPAVARAFAQAASFSAELDMNPLNLLQASQHMFAAEGQGLKAQLAPELYRRSAALLARRGIPEMLAARMKVWAAAATLSTPPSSSGLFLDLQLYQQALASGKPVYGLETVAEQLGTLESMPLAMQKAMLEDAIEQQDQLAGLIEQLIRAYAANDLRLIERISNQAMAGSDRDVVRHVNEQVVIERNRRMLERMLPRLREGKAFLAVGALHLPGENGLVALLRGRGYRMVGVEW